MLRVSANSEADVERLWAVLSKLPSWGGILPTFTSVTQVDGPTPIDTGSRFEVFQPGLRKATYEVTAWEPGHGFTWAARAPGLLTTATHTVTATETGSRIELGIGWTGPVAALVRLVFSRKALSMIESEATTMARLADADE